VPQLQPCSAEEWLVTCPRGRRHFSFLRLRPVTCLTQLAESAHIDTAQRPRRPAAETRIHFSDRAGGRPCPGQRGKQRPGLAWRRTYCRDAGSFAGSPGRPRSQHGGRGQRGAAGAPAAGAQRCHTGRPPYEQRTVAAARLAASGGRPSVARRSWRRRARTPASWRRWCTRCAGSSTAHATLRPPPWPHRAPRRRAFPARRDRLHAPAAQGARGGCVPARRKPARRAPR